MPHFYFDVATGERVIPDREGLNLPSVEVARREAMTTAAAMARDFDRNDGHITICIRDGATEPVATVRLTLTCE